MSVIPMRGFEDTEVWQDARRLTKTIYQLTSIAPFAKDWGLIDQVRRASISIMANIAEGSERGTTKEFVHFLSIALGSAAELRSHLYISKDLSYITQDQMEELINSVNSIVRQLKGLRRSLSLKKSSSTSSSTSRKTS